MAAFCMHTHAHAHTASKIAANSLTQLQKAAAKIGHRHSSKNLFPGYQDEVYNATVAFCHVSGLDLAVRYCFKRADLQAAAQDHAYLPLPLTEM